MPPAKGDSSDIVRREPGPISAATAWDSREYQDLWMSIQRSEWRSLAVLPVGPGIDSLRVAETIAKIAWSNRGQPMSVVDFRDLSIRLLEHQMNELAAYCVHRGEHAVIALRAVQENPTARSVAERSDAIVLCVALESSRLEDAKKIINGVGRSRFVGVLVVK